MTPSIAAVDHFAGVGWSVACRALGVVDYGVEIAPSVIRTRSANGMRTLYRNVWAGLHHPWLVPPHRLYLASPPCQTFSMSGGGEGRQALEDVYEAIDDRRWADPARLSALTEIMDERTALVLTPLAHIFQHRPELVALEQVPPVLPVWRRIARVLRTLGYSAWSGLLNSEQYGVPQTRQRAILLARLDGPVKPPTHSRYYSSNPRRLDAGVPRWVSMAEALGWGMTSRPYPTIAGARETGGPDKEKVGGSAARAAIYAERDAGRDAGRWVETGQNSAQAGGGSEPYRRSVDLPSPTVTGQSRSWVYRNGNRKNAARRPLDAPAPTVLFGAAKNDVVWEAGDAPQPEDAVTDGKVAWPFERPATTVVASFSPDVIAAPGHRGVDTSRQNAPGSVRVTLGEAAALQSFPSDFIWQGSKTSRFQIVGNAVPPLLAEAIISSLLGEPQARSPWDDVFAEVAG